MADAGNPFDEEPENPFDEDPSNNPFEENIVNPFVENSSSVIEAKNVDVKTSETPKLKLKTSASIVRTLIPLEESTAQHHELFLQEIEAVDEYWGPTFRGVYESGQHELFLERLEERIKKHDKDIEKMCSHHYQGFIDSVRDLLRVRSEATQLKKEVESIDCEVRASSAKVISGAEKLVKARTTETNIAATIEALSLCLPGRSLNQRTAE